jgi:hypothetical protein
MNQREEVIRAWNKYSKAAYRSPQFEKARAFFEMVEQRQDICWDDLVNEFRNHYSDALDEITSVLIATDDPLVLYNFVRYADTSNPKEAEVVKAFIRRCDAERHQVSLLSVAEVPDMRPELKKKAQLPEPVREALGMKKAKHPVQPK